ncbi:MAG: ArdC-like ssDNA-binding domain-containing protein [Saccharofermentans sp.]|nr:ArdC-like ssDNA-binding domain-containing protein [Saccharofermentans sp.]
MAENEHDIMEFSKLTKEEQHAYLKKQDEERKQLMKQLEEDAYCRCSTDPQELLKCLDIIGRFERLSLSNNILLYAQCPEASTIKTFDEWKKQKVSIKKNSEGILLRKRVSTGTYVENNEVKQSFVFKSYYTFDVSQTNCRPGVRQKYPITLCCLAFDDLVSKSYKTHKVEPDDDGTNLSMYIYSYIHTLLTNNNADDANFKACSTTVAVCYKLGFEIHPDIKTALGLELGRYISYGKPLKSVLMVAKTTSITFVEEFMTSMNDVAKRLFLNRPDN